MARVVVVNHVTLDGVMQAPGRPEEDTRDGFVYGGWATARNDEAIFAKIGERMAGGGACLFGRRRLFPAGVASTPRLTDSVTTSTGVLIAIHQPTRDHS